MKKILNFFFNSNSTNYSSNTIGYGDLAFSLGNDSFVASKEIKLKDLTISINSIDFITTGSSWKTWNYIPDAIYVILENNKPSNCSYIRNDFPYFCFLNKTDVFTDSLVTSANIGVGYTNRTYQYSLPFKPPKIDLSTNLCVFSFWAFDMRGSDMKVNNDLFLGTYTPDAGGDNAPLRKLNITAKASANDLLKCGININISLEI